MLQDSSTKFIIERHDDRYLSVDGRKCVKIERAKTFNTRQKALDFIDDCDTTKMYLSPSEQENDVTVNWIVKKLTYSVTN